MFFSLLGILKKKNKQFSYHASKKFETLDKPPCLSRKTCHRPIFTAAMRTHAFTTIITPTRSSPIPSQQHNKFVEFGLFS